jgi:hypothetical protein
MRFDSLILGMVVEGLRVNGKRKTVRDECVES